MTRILVIEPAGNLWGSERALLDLIAGLEPSATAVCLPSRTPLQPRLAQLGIKTYPHLLPALHLHSKWRRAVSALGILRACIDHKPDIIYLNQAGVYRVARPAAAMLRLGIVAHVRIFEDAAYLAGCNPSPTQLRAMIAISKAIESEIRTHEALSELPVLTAYDAYQPTAAKIDRDHPLRESATIACIGRIAPIKGQDVLAGAMPIVLSQRPDARCLMIGDGLPDFVAKAKAAGGSAGGSLEWLGYQGDVTTYLHRCSVLVCPSWREPLGRVVFEAWDAGVIPIAFAGSGGAAEVIAAADGGLLYSKQEPESIGQAILEALTLDRGERRRLVDNGRAWMKANCDQAAYARAFSGFLAQCAA